MGVARFSKMSVLTKARHITSLKTAFFIVTTLKISNLTQVHRTIQVERMQYWLPLLMVGD
jgi:hypothetical protein